MDLSNIKLVATDMDGTLLDTKGRVSDNFFELYHELTKQGVHFAAASGRQYHSIISKLESIKDDITIIAENGAVTNQKDKTLLLTDLPKETIHELITMIRNFQKPDIYYVLCGKDRAYIEQDNPDFINFFHEFYAEYQLVEDLLAIENDNFLKIAIYCPFGSEENIYPLVKHLEGKLQVKVSGEFWLDLSDLNANKGHALQDLQKLMNISKEETLVFGDYNNDLEMFEQAAISVAMKNAHPNIIKASTLVTKSNDEQGVEIILEQLLAAKRAN